MTTITQERWQTAQAAESKHWDGVNIESLLRICYNKPVFLNLVGEKIIPSLFDRQEVLEIGVGPLSLSLASFYANKQDIKRLVKVEPLERQSIAQLSVTREKWAETFVKWVEQLSNEGEYVQLPGEQINYEQEFDTVITYNVLDHVHDPLSILQNAHKALRPNGQILVGVDCKSVIGKIQFEYFLRRLYQDRILVKAHPHTFLPSQVVSLLKESGFEDVQMIGIPSFTNQIIGKTFRPAFLAKKSA